jgi:hypothetical protein
MCSSIYTLCFTSTKVALLVYFLADPHKPKKDIYKKKIMGLTPPPPPINTIDAEGDNMP